MPSLPHHGFAQPFLGILLVLGAAFALAPSAWVAVALVGGFAVLLTVAAAVARRRALSRIRRWAAASGIRDVQPCPRDGFVSWAWSLWSVAEIQHFRGQDSKGSPQELLASYYAPAFGVVLFVRCELIP
jgi:hypothetical protein